MQDPNDMTPAEVTNWFDQRDRLRRRSHRHQVAGNALSHLTAAIAGALIILTILFFTR